MDLLRGAALREPIDDPDLNRRVAVYLADQQTIVTRYRTARTADDKNTALADLIAHAEQHNRLIDEVIRYQSDRGNFARPPANAPAVDEHEQSPAKHGSRPMRTRAAKTE